MSTPGSADRWRGALLGTALGDAVGAPFEGHRHPAVQDVERWLSSDARLTWTDDTAMAIGLARSLVACGGIVDPQHLGDTFAADYRAEPWRGYGAGPPKIFAAAERGASYLDAAASAFGGTGSFGNGAAMRVVPAAILGGNDRARVTDVARAQARVTHAHPLGQDWAALLALAVAAVATDPVGDPAARIAEVLNDLETDQMRVAGASAVRLGELGDPSRIVSELGHGIAAHEAVPAAIAWFLLSVDDPWQTLAQAVTGGGDTDTIAAMAGSLVGAHVGASGLPERLLERLESRDRLRALADELLTTGTWPVSVRHGRTS